jgi:hypothetical protein
MVIGIMAYFTRLAMFHDAFHWQFLVIWDSYFSKQQRAIMLTEVELTDLTLVSANEVKQRPPR